jgi:hypothetical protein
MVYRSDPETIKKIRTIVEANLARPRSERFADMIARGIIDEHGQVIYKDEEPVNGRKSNGAAKKNGSAAKKKTKKKPASGKKS